MFQIKPKARPVRLCAHAVVASGCVDVIWARRTSPGVLEQPSNMNGSYLGVLLEIYEFPVGPGMRGHPHLGRPSLPASCPQANGLEPTLEDSFLAGAARAFRPAPYDHAQLSRHDVEPCAHIRADSMQAVPAAGAGAILDIDDHLDARQLGGQRPAVRPAPCSAWLLLVGGGAFPGFLPRRLDLLRLFEPSRSWSSGSVYGLAPTHDVAFLTQTLCPPFRTRNGIVTTT
jgi:hypothetical protein